MCGLRRLLVSHIDRHSLQQAAVYLVQFGQLSRHLFRFVAEHGTVDNGAVIHFANAAQATVDMFDRFDLRADALQLYFVDRVQAGDVAVQHFHLLHVTAGILVDAIRIIRNALIRIQKCVGNVGQRMRHLAETFHILGHTRKLFQIFLRRFRQFRHLGDLFGGGAQFLDTVGKVFRIFFAHIQAEIAQSGSLLAA